MLEIARTTNIIDQFTSALNYIMWLIASNRGCWISAMLIIERTLNLIWLMTDFKLANVAMRKGGSSVWSMREEGKKNLGSALYPCHIGECGYLSRARLKGSQQTCFLTLDKHYQIYHFLLWIIELGCAHHFRPQAEKQSIHSVRRQQIKEKKKRRLVAFNVPRIDTLQF